LLDRATQTPAANKLPVTQKITLKRISKILSEYEENKSISSRIHSEFNPAALIASRVGGGMHNFHYVQAEVG
jgi:hypothetical protein